MSKPLKILKLSNILRLLNILKLLKKYLAFIFNNTIFYNLLFLVNKINFYFWVQLKYNNTFYKVFIFK